MNLLCVMQNNSSQFLPMFLGSYRTELTADTLLGLFTVKEWSPEGSNSRESEEAVMFNWENYVRETEGIMISMLAWGWGQLGERGKHSSSGILLILSYIIAGGHVIHGSNEEVHLSNILV